jgi:hypothetical protein
MSPLSSLDRVGKAVVVVSLLPIAAELRRGRAFTSA